MTVYGKLRASALVRIIPRPESVIDFDPVLFLQAESDEKDNRADMLACTWNVIYMRVQANGAGYNIRRDGRLYRLVPESGRLRCDFMPNGRLEVTDDFMWARVAAGSAT